MRDQQAFYTKLTPVLGTELDEDGNLKPIGYRFSRRGLRQYLRNRNLIGEWEYEGEWIPDNHLPIIPRDLFDFAQECLDRNIEEDVRKHHTPGASVVYDILYAGPQGSKRYINRRMPEGVYRIIEEHGIKTQLTVATVAIDEIERIFIEKFTERLQETDRFKSYEQRLARQEQKINDRRTYMEEKIKQLTERIDGIFMTLQSPNLEPDDRDGYIKERNRLKQQRRGLEEELKVQTPLQTYLKYKDLIRLMGKYWDRYPFEDRQALVALLVNQVYLECLSGRFMQISIEWKHFPCDIGFIRRSNAASLHWTDEEKEILRQMYPTEPAHAILEALPRRSWVSMVTRASDLGVRRIGKNEPVPLADVSLEDMQIVERYGIPIESLTKMEKSLFVSWSDSSPRWRHV